MRDQMKTLADKIISKLNCEDYEIDININDSIMIRYAQNRITQNIVGENYQVSLTVSENGRSGKYIVNSIEDDSIDFMIMKAFEMMNNSVKDPEFAGSGIFIQIPEVKNYCESTINCTMDDMGCYIEKIIYNAVEKEANVSGFMTRNISYQYSVTKNGFQAYDKTTNFSNSMTMAKGKRETKIVKSVKGFKNYNIDAELENLNRRFSALSEPLQSEIGKYNVILMPEAVLNFFQMMFWYMNRRDSDLGMSPYYNQLNKLFFGEKFTFRSDIDDNDLTVKSYNPNGVVAKSLEWIKNGVIKNLPLDKAYANKIGEIPNLSANFIIDGENNSIDDLMKKVDNGLIINNFWYIRNVDSKKGEITGLTRDGVNYFENGEIKHSLTNLRFNEIPYEVTRKILALGESALLTDYSKVPAMLIKDFNFVDVTTF
ncbi:MAG: hypothetical protein JXR48_08065 [Candidatus Delongbacteria bacterium]|nr:hypothetical protein [Candidatus Delongbacteria bacterium]MBN2834908.1 hypothetical protein [Candidatus Delongbacteria bacterium]